MKIPEHIALSYLLAQLGVQQQFGPAGTALIIVAGNLPDLDGMTILGGWNCHRTYHRVVGHGLPMTLLGPGLLAWFAASILGLGSFLVLWAWFQIALLAHLITDILFYLWPVQLCWPLSARGLGLGLVRWNDLVPTLLLYAGVLLSWYADPQIVAGICLGLVTAYVLTRAWSPAPYCSWTGWLAGNWAKRSARLWRWLTGDFIT
jgi:membrane-bound metal-dependent hydrolase YbcI (DUF457 family)